MTGRENEREQIEPLTKDMPECMSAQVSVAKGKGGREGKERETDWKGI